MKESRTSIEQAYVSMFVRIATIGHWQVKEDQNFITHYFLPAKLLVTSRLIEVNDFDREL